MGDDTKGAWKRRDMADDNEMGCAGGSEQAAMSTGESLDVSKRLYARATPSTPAVCFRPNHFRQAVCRP